MIAQQYHFGNYRGKRKDTHEWVYGYIWQGENHTYIIPSDKAILSEPVNTNGLVQLTAYAYEVDPETTTAFTFLFDEDDKRIYHGDYVSNGKNRYTVRWHIELQQTALFDKHGNFVKICTANTLRNMKIIGNIYDCPTE